jgi:hypothetical protein
MKKISLFGYATCSLILCSIAHSSTLAYEGFNYGDTSQDIGGQAVGNGAYGFSGNYTTVTGTSGNSNVQTSTYNSTGLSFSGYQTTGGSLTLSVAPTIDETKEYVYSYINFDTTATGTVYQSFLANVSVNTMSSGSAGTQIRSQSNASLTGKTDSGMTVEPVALGLSGSKPKIGYDADTQFAGGSSVTLGTTYLYIAKYTNVGETGGGTASLWVLDNVSFLDWQSNGGLEADLDLYADFTSTDTASSTISLSDSESMRLTATEFSVDYNTGATSYSVSGELTTTYDEIRYGTSLSDIIVIPEPSAYSLILSGLTLGMVMIRRRRS